MNSELIRLYSYIPNFPGKLYLGNKVFQPTGIVEHRLKYFSAALDLDDRIQRRMLIKRCHEPETESLFLKYAREANCLYDVGANIGYFSLLALAANPDIEVQAFEPLPTNATRIRENAELNPGFHKQLSVQELCVGKESGEVSFGIPQTGEAGWGRILNEGQAWQASGSLKRAVISLDDWIAKGHAAPDLIKIDVEGNELQVLQGAKHLLETSKRLALCVEINEGCLVANGTSGEEIFGWLLTRGFKAYAFHGLRAWRKVARPVPNYKFLNYFFVKA